MNNSAKMSSQAGRRLLQLLLFIILVITLIAFKRIPVSATNATIDIAAEYHQEMARSVLDMINADRTSGNAWYWNQDDYTKTYCGYLPALEYDYALEKIAMQRADEIAVYFDHVRPDGRRFSTAYSDYGYSYVYIGENIAAGTMYTAENVHIAWMEENEMYGGQGHRRNILNPNYTSVGIACVYIDGCYYWVEEFSSYTNSSIPVEYSNEVQGVPVNVQLEAVEITGPATDSRDEHVYTAWDYSHLEENDYLPRMITCVMLDADETIDIPVLGYRFKYNPEFDGICRSSFTSECIVYADLNWTSSDSAIVSVSDGRITAHACGNAKLRAYVGTELIELNVNVDHYSEPYIIPATADSYGEITYKCRDCGQTAGSSTQIPKLGIVAVDTSDKVYTGKEIKPEVVVYDTNRNVVSSDNYTITYQNNKNVGTATIKVTYKNLYSGERIINFKIVPSAPTIKSVSTKSGFKVSWKKLSVGCDGYEIQYASDEGFTKNTKIVTVKGRTKTSKKLSLKKNKSTRYVRIRAYKSVGGVKYYSEWSKVKSGKY